MFVADVAHEFFPVFDQRRFSLRVLVDVFGEVEFGGFEPGCEFGHGLSDQDFALRALVQVFDVVLFFDEFLVFFR